MKRWNGLSSCSRHAGASPDRGCSANTLLFSVFLLDSPSRALFQYMASVFFFSLVEGLFPFLPRSIRPTKFSPESAAPLFKLMPRPYCLLGFSLTRRATRTSGSTFFLEGIFFFEKSIPRLALPRFFSRPSLDEKNFQPFLGISLQRLPPPFHFPQ